jgi:hypothetical protein
MSQHVTRCELKCHRLPTQVKVGLVYDDGACEDPRRRPSSELVDAHRPGIVAL